MNDVPVVAQGDTPGSLIYGFGEAARPGLAAFDVRTAMASDPATLDPAVLDTWVLSVVGSWSSITDRQGATAWLAQAVPGVSAEALADLNDLALASGALLRDAAAAFARAWEAIAADGTTRGNIALEGWVRLALGGWTASTLKLRAELSERAARASLGEVCADIYLVRSLGAALDAWKDEELEDALRQLVTLEDVECDAAFELGMSRLRSAVEAETPESAASWLRQATELFEAANVEGERPDAVAFGTACDAVQAFIGGGAVTDLQVERIRAAASEWQVGYQNMPPHWRQARAETGAAWASLLLDLYDINEVHETVWMQPMNLVADIGRIYVSHNASELLATPTGAPEGQAHLANRAATLEIETEEPAAFALLHPALDERLAATAYSRTVVDRWLHAVSRDASVEQATIDAIGAARERLREAPPPLGKAAASRGERTTEDVREALREAIGDDEVAAIVLTAVAPILARVPLVAPVVGALAERVPRIAEQELIRTICEELQATRPSEFALWASFVTALVEVLVKVVAITIDHEQGGTRALPWQNWSETPKPPEHLLADFLQVALELRNFTAYVEVSNSGGGRADVLVQMDRERFVIEVKRILTTRTDQQLTDDYGPQASQYTLTGAPFAFLAVLDASRHSSRLDLGHSFWVGSWSHAELPEISRPVVGFRILADVPSPSATPRSTRAGG
ncbi:hypothetical protein ACFVSK_04120 [Cellulosimicrobium cellulans]|uniref:hypothetical protein n=1 Tax=Cellulosimicrobium cellulans TaxID=1710 RepID=UPI0036E240B8